MEYNKVREGCVQTVRCVKYGLAAWEGRELVCLLFWLNKPTQINKTNQIDQMNQINAAAVSLLPSVGR